MYNVLLQLHNLTLILISFGDNFFTSPSNLSPNPATYNIMNEYSKHILRKASSMQYYKPQIFSKLTQPPPPKYKNKIAQTLHIELNE